MPRPLTLNPARVVRLLAVIVVVLVLGNLVTQLASAITGHTRMAGLVQKMNLDRENNLATYLSSAMLLGASGLLAAIGWSGEAAVAQDARRWKTLSFIFLYLSLDEGASLHEMTIRPLRGALHTAGILYFAWVLVGIPLVALFGLMYLRFLTRLPARTRVLFITAAALYVTGGLGIELVGGAYAAVHGTRTFGYNLVVMLEESLEMAGVVTFLYALLDFIATSTGEVRIRVGGTAPSG